MPCVSGLCRAPACFVFPVSSGCHLCRRPKQQPHAEWDKALLAASRKPSRLRKTRWRLRTLEPHYEAGELSIRVATLARY